MWFNVFYALPVSVGYHDTEDCFLFVLDDMLIGWQNAYVQFKAVGYAYFY